MTEQESLKWFEWVNPSNICQGCVCACLCVYVSKAPANNLQEVPVHVCVWVCVCMFLKLQRTIYNCSFVFTSSHAEPSRSARGERLDPSWVFFDHTHSPSCACGHGNFQEQISLSQPLRTSKFSVLLSRFFGQCLIGPNLQCCFG